MTEWPVTIAAEGALDLAVLRRLAREADLTLNLEYGRRGKAHIDQRLPAYNAAARHQPWIVLRDLDNDRDCAVELVMHLLPAPARLMKFRIAVRTVEAWLLADHERFKTAFGVAARAIPTVPESVDRRNAAMLEAISRSNRREIKSAMLSKLASGGWHVGPEYNARLEQFASEIWQPRVAETRSASLAKARVRIQELAKLVRQR